MIDRIVHGDVETLPDYDQHYNRLPKDWERISEESFWSKFMQYCWEFQDFKQVKFLSESYYANTRLWMMRHWKMTVGIAAAYVQGNPPIYIQFGPWPEYGAKFAAQFAGDNS